MQEYLTMLLELAEKVRKAILNSSKIQGIDSVVAFTCNDVLRKIDKIAENALIESLEDQNIPVLLISEGLDGKLIGGDQPEVVIVADPLDGTANFINSIPFYSVCLSLAKFKTELTTESLIVGVVKDVVRGTTYYGVKNKGAYCNSEKISPTKKSTVETVSFYVYGPKADPKFYRLPRKLKTRTLGCVGLEMCYVASGLLDAFIDVRNLLRITDLSASYVILKEANAVVTNLTGEQFLEDLRYMSGLSLIASGNKFIHDQILKLMNVMKP